MPNINRYVPVFRPSRRKKIVTTSGERCKCAIVDGET